MIAVRRFKASLLRSSSVDIQAVLESLSALFNLVTSSRAFNLNFLTISHCHSFCVQSTRMVVSLAAVFWMSRNAPPKERCVTSKNRPRGRLCGWGRCTRKGKNIDARQNLGPTYFSLSWRIMSPRREAIFLPLMKRQKPQKVCKKKTKILERTTVGNFHFHNLLIFPRPSLSATRLASVIIYLRTKPRVRRAKF